MIKLKDILNEVERLGIDTPIRDGVAFWENGKPSSQTVEVIVDKKMGNIWNTLVFDLRRMKVKEVGTLREPMISGQVVAKLTPAIKNKIKKIAKDPQEADFINKDYPNMVQKLMRAIKWLNSKTY